MKDKDAAHDDYDIGEDVEKESMHEKVKQKDYTLKAEDKKLYFVRLTYSERVQHMIFVICFIVLVITGFMLKIPAEMVERLGEVGGVVFYYRSIIHRTAGVTMILISLYHVYYLAFRPSGRRWFVDMFPRVKDITDMIKNIRYYLGLEDQPPEFDRFCYKHKLEYFALIAGTLLMAATGLLLWMESFWHKFILDIAVLVHGMEAILASLAIMVWHLYEVHLRPHKFPLDNMWITGFIDEEEMQEEYPLHYKKIMKDPKLKEIYVKR
jgi:cytochrome b subunit of formate dehydrogenase